MVQVIKDDIDRAIIHAFYDAWKRVRGQLWQRAKDESKKKNIDYLPIYYAFLEVRSEKIRNEILRLKTPDLLAGWFLRFCADATKGRNLIGISDNADQILKFIFNARNFNRFQNLLLFALVSYKSDETITETNKNGDN